jgi:hypothetical protein
MNFYSIINKIMVYKGFDNEKEVAKLFRLSGSDLSNRKKRGTLLPFIIDWATNENVNLNWLLKEDHAESVEKRLEKLTPLPLEELSEASGRFLQLPALLDLSDEDFCKKIDFDLIEMDKIRAGYPVPGLANRAVAYEFGVRMRWLKMGENPFRSPSGAPNHYAQEIIGLIEQGKL